MALATGIAPRYLMEMPAVLDEIVALLEKQRQEAANG